MTIDAPAYPTDAPTAPIPRQVGAIARPLNSAEKAHMAELDRLLAARDNAGFVERALKPANPLMLAATMDWAKMRMHEGAGLPVVLIYSRALWIVGSSAPSGGGLKETSTAVALYGVLLTLSDGTKCADKTPVDNRFRTILSGYQEQIQYLKQLPRASAERAVWLAVRLEEGIAGYRDYDNYLCRGGLQEMQDYLATHDAEKLPRQTGPGIVGANVIIPTDPAYEPKYNSRAEWEPRQREARRTFAGLLEQIAPLSGR
jgi:hypothetical protein